MNEKNEIASINSTSALRLQLQGIRLFSNCTPSFLDGLASRSRTQRLPKGQMLFVCDEKADRFFFVVGGWMKLFRETLDGAQAVVDIIPAGHIFGETAIFQNDQYPFSAEAAEESEILVMPLSILKAEIESNPKIALSMLKSMAHYRRLQDQELEHRTLQNASQRIGCFLLRLIDQESEGRVTIHLPYDKTLVASRLGMQPETFSRALAKLKASVDMEVRGATIELGNVQELSEYACAACSSGFPCKDVERSTIF